MNNLLTAALTFAAVILTPVASAQTATPRATIVGTHPSWANDTRRVSASAVASGTVFARVYLAGQDPAGLSALVEAVSTPGNALYGQYLSPEDVKAKFGPSDGAISAVSAWLTGAGLTVTHVDNRVAGFVEASGSAQVVAAAFGVSFGTFLGPDNKADRAPEQEATVPGT